MKTIEVTAYEKASAYDYAGEAISVNPEHVAYISEKDVDAGARGSLRKVALASGEKLYVSADDARRIREAIDYP